MSVKELLLQQLAAVHNKKDWFVSLNDAAAGLTQEEIIIKTPGEEHSIKELVIHILFWSEWYLNRLRGNFIEPQSDDNEFTFTEECIGETNIEWNRLLERTNNVLNEWHIEIENITEEKLASTLPNGTTWQRQISNIILHIAYHTGEIIVLRKIQNNWDSRYGVS